MTRCVEDAVQTAQSHPEHHDVAVEQIRAARTLGFLHDMQVAEYIALLHRGHYPVPVQIYRFPAQKRDSVSPSVSSPLSEAA